MKKINLSELGKMLNAAFGANEIDGLTFNVAYDLQDEISHLPKSKKVIEIIKYTARHGKLEQAIQYTKDNNPYQFGKFEAVLYDQSVGNDPIPTPNNTPVLDDADADVKAILAEMKSLRQELKEKGAGENITINYSIGDVGSNSNIIQGDNSGNKQIDKNQFENTIIHGSVNVNNYQSQAVQAGTQERYQEVEQKFEAAMPRCSTLNKETEVWVMISRPNSKGLKALLPDYTEEGDIINSEDNQKVRSIIEFPLDKNNNLLPRNILVTLRFDQRYFSASDFNRSKIVKIRPNADSSKITFYLTPLTLTGVANISVELLDNRDPAKPSLINSITLITQIVQEKRYCISEKTVLKHRKLFYLADNYYDLSPENITINYAKGDNVTDHSKNYSIGDVGDNVTLAQGDGAQATSDRSVSVGGKNTGNIITGDENTVTDKSKKQDIKIEGSTISGSNIGIMADAIKNSFNTVAQSEASSEVKTALKAMLDAVAKLDEVIEESKDLKIIKKMSTNIVQEVDDEILDEEQANTYIERLKKAAHNIGDIAKPVIDTAVAVAVALKATGVF